MSKSPFSEIVPTIAFGNCRGPDIYNPNNCLIARDRGTKVVICPFYRTFHGFFGDALTAIPRLRYVNGRVQLAHLNCGTQFVPKGKVR